VRVTAGGSGFSYNLLGLGSATDGSGTTSYTRDAQQKLMSERTPSGTYYYLFDGLGSVVALTDGSGAVVASYQYDPYGRITASSGTVANPWRYTGAYQDSSTGLYKLGQRYYDPALGRWTQQDPLPHLGDPRQQNRYAYVGNSPCNFTDPWAGQLLHWGGYLTLC
jgi:RHS repeat-associated protein